MEKDQEKEKTPICKHGIQIESCRQCLFQTLCSYEEMCEKNKVWRGGSFGREKE